MSVISRILSKRRWKPLTIGTLLVIGFILSQKVYMHFLHRRHVSSFTKGWKLSNIPLARDTSENNDFRLVFKNGAETYFLSAIASRDLEKQDMKIVLTAFDSLRGNGDFLCCVLYSDGTMYSTQVEFYHIHYHIDFLPSITQLFNQAPFHATQYVCRTPIPDVNVSVVNISLTTLSVCGSNKRDYLPVQMQEDKRDKLAICGKVAFGDKLKPSRLVEWFEMQKILGVDKVVVFDLDCPEQIKTVFKHYIDEGLLEVIPYSLPGKVPGYPHRGFRLKEQVNPQFSHDKHLTVLDCHQRLGGYSYVLAADFDEIIIPSHHFTLKQLLQNLASKSPYAAGFYFHVQFHLENWGRVRTDSDIYFQQYLTSTKPRWECEKYIYIPSRTKSTTIHSFQPIYPFSKNYVDIKEATIHHYRQCPLGWKNCYPEVITDKQVSKYEELHTVNTFKVFHKLNITPYDRVTQTSEI